METLKLSTARRNELLDITDSVQAAVAHSQVKEGVCIVFCPHTTAGLTINENADPDVTADMLNALGRLIPADAGYAHSEGNSDGHIKSSVFGSSVSVIVEGGRLKLGTWQGVYFCEADGPRQRQVWIKVLKG